MVYFAHSNSKKDKSEWHLLKKHLVDTAEKSSTFACSFGAEKLGYLVGLLHDIGKYSLEFQKRLEGDPTRVNHSTAGAIEADQAYKRFGKLLAYIIAGHHSGLPDWGSVASESSLEARLNKGDSIPDYRAYKHEIVLPKPEEVLFPKLNPVMGQGFTIQFLVRFLFSSLVDADFLDTERALNLDRSSLRGGTESLTEMVKILDQFLVEKSRNALNSTVNQWRSRILSRCMEQAHTKPGLFSLTVPTGGGKTLSSMAFALHHAVTHRKDRIIYVIPYTSIIEQNAAVFRSIFGSENILEHHSNFELHEEMEAIESENQMNVIEKLKMSSENWDMPIVVTTNVQFFESLYASKSSRCRKLHNIANSVVIMDEAQMIPTSYLQPCLHALVELITNYQSTVVLCTATQPAIKKFLPLDTQPIEIIDKPEDVFTALKRVEVTFLGDHPLTDDSIAERLLVEKQVLCIVNTKKHAREIFQKIDQEGTYHLSTRMCPVHRSGVLKEIRQALKKGQTCRVVSTQLIEAGVDVDFPVVYRSIAGIDSIAQSAGRCNREGKREKGQLYVFRPEKHGLPSGWLQRTAEIGSNILKQYRDPTSLEAVNDYFTQLFDIERDQLDRQHILPLIKEQEKLLRFPFRSIAERFKLIDQNTKPIIIQWDKDCRVMIEDVRKSEFPITYLRKLQKYTVQVFEKEFNDMLQIKMLEDIAGKFYVLREDVFDKCYNSKTGLLPCTDSMLVHDTLLI